MSLTPACIDRRPKARCPVCSLGGPAAALLLALLLLAGCGTGDTAQGPPAAPDLLDGLPDDWQPLSFGERTLLTTPRMWHPISIDGDPEDEFLLFFTYDGGPMGVNIYDLQIAGDARTSPTPVPVQEKPSADYETYRIVPNYWTGAGQVGYVAPAGTVPASVTWRAVTRSELPVDAAAGDSADVTVVVEPLAGDSDELLIFGGPTVITAIWWRSADTGYGVTQLAARGGFVEAQYENGSETRSLLRIVGLDPVDGLLARSALCEQTLYERSRAAEPTDADAPPFRPAVDYLPTSLGLGFCDNTPDYPFYPEGVVLALLHGAVRMPVPQLVGELEVRLKRFAPQLSDGDRQTLLDLIDFDGPDNDTLAPLAVEELYTPETVTIGDGYRTPAGGPLMTTVCVRVQPVKGAESRLVHFNLMHVQPAFTGAEANRTVVTDRLQIAGISAIAPSFTNCEAAVNQLSLPGRP